MITDYLDFELELGPGDLGAGWPVVTLQSPAGNERAVLRLPVAPEQLALEAQQLDSAGAQSFGRQLFDLLLGNSPVGRAYTESLGVASAQGKGLRVRLRIVDPALAVVPWELIYEQRFGDFMALSRETPLLRMAEAAQPMQPLAVSPPLRILGLAVDPIGELDLAAERAAVESALAGLVLLGQADLTWLAGGTLRDIQSALRGSQGAWHVFHFIGHGYFDDTVSQGAVLLAGDDGSPEILDGNRLGRLLASHAAMRLAVLDACNSAAHRTSDLYVGLASSLARRGVSAVVATQFAVPVEVAQEWNRTFYAALADGKPFEYALTEARIAASMDPGLDWAAPVAYLRSETGELFNISPATESVAEERASDTGKMVIPAPILSGRLYGLLQDALLDDFNAHELRAMVRYELNEDLAAIAGTGRLAEVIYNLISWAERNGRIGELIQGAITTRPGNRKLQSLGNTLGMMAGQFALRSDIVFPAQVQRDTPNQLIVQLHVDNPTDIGSVESVSVTFADQGDFARTERLTVRVLAPDFDEETNSYERTIDVYSNRNSEPVGFLLRASEPGKKRITVDFYHSGRMIGSAFLEVEVVATLQGDESIGAVYSSDSAQTFPGFDGNPPPPADLQLRVVIDTQKNTLTFWLNSTHRELSYDWMPLGEVHLNGDPMTWLAEKLGPLDELAAFPSSDQTATESARAEQELNALAEGLFDELLPVQFRIEYFERILPLLYDGSIKSFVIISDEPWIPWELLKPYYFNASENKEYSANFWALDFQLCHWLAGRGPAPRVDVKNAALVLPDVGLVATAKEKAFFEALVAKQSFRLIGPAQTRAEVESLFMSGGYEILHVSTHSKFGKTDADTSELYLSDENLRAADLRASQMLGIRRYRPLVYLNVSFGGRIGFGKVGLGGWAIKFIKEANASAFVGPLWDVEDNLAAEFAQHFYERLIAGDTLGEAMRATRVHVRTIDPLNPTWLAYALYGDPNATVRFIGEEFEGPRVAKKRATSKHQPSESGDGADWFVDVLGAPVDEVEVFSACTLVLRFSQVMGRTKIRIPATASALSVYIDIEPGLELVTNRHVIVDAVDGKLNLAPIEIAIRPISPGAAQLDVSLHMRDGSGESSSVSLPPVMLHVAALTSLPAIPELLDTRIIPAPEPDVWLYVASEPAIERNQVQQDFRIRIYLTCPMLGWDMVKLDPLLLNPAEIVALNQTAAEIAVEDSYDATNESSHALQRFGMLLYDLLAPKPTTEHPNTLRRRIDQLDRLARGLNRPLTWLVVADSDAALPWEMLWPYGTSESDSGFLGENHIIAHWIGRLDLKMRSEAPVRRAEIVHYRAHSDRLPLWQRALGGPQWSVISKPEETLLLADPDTDVVGLHLIKYVDADSSAQPVSARYGGIGQDVVLRAANARRLDFAAKHPIVGLSFVDESIHANFHAPPSPSVAIQHWVLPMLRAEASAVVAARWPVAPEADQCFFQEFYSAVHQGTSLGRAVLYARQAVRRMFPGRSDWLAYAYFGHPQCEPYWASEVEAFAAFEVLGHPKEQPLGPGQTYDFRATYGSMIPAIYGGRVFLEGPLPELHEPKVEITAGFLDETLVAPLKRNGQSYMAQIELTMPPSRGPARLLVYFLDGEEVLEVLRHTVPVDETQFTVEDTQ